MGDDGAALRQSGLRLGQNLGVHFGARARKTFRVADFDGFDRDVVIFPAGEPAVAGGRLKDQPAGRQRNAAPGLARPNDNIGDRPACRMVGDRQRQKFRVRARTGQDRLAGAGIGGDAAADVVEPRGKAQPLVRVVGMEAPPGRRRGMPAARGDRGSGGGGKECFVRRGPRSQAVAIAPADRIGGDALVAAGEQRGDQARVARARWLGRRTGPCRGEKHFRRFRRDAPRWIGRPSPPEERSRLVSGCRRRLNSST